MVDKPGKKVAIITPLAMKSVPLEFHLSYVANMQYLQMHVDELPLYGSSEIDVFKPTKALINQIFEIV